MAKSKNTVKDARSATAETNNVVQLPRAPRIEDLPFVVDRARAGLPKPTGKQSPRCFWHVSPTGKWGDDCRTGEMLAVEYLKVQSGKDAPGSFLQWIVEDMPRELTGVEVGFLTIVGHSAAAGAPYGYRLFQYWEQCREEGKV